MNLQNFAVHRLVAPTPVDISPERRSTYSLATAGNAGGRSSQRSQTADLFRTTPVNRSWGFGRGTPLDRPFIDQFIKTHRGDIRGQILEIKAAEYAGKYARPDSRIDILDIDPANVAANIIDDLQSAAKIENDSYDCVVLTQVLQLIPDVERAITTAARILRPSGVLLMTVPGITQTVATTDGEFLRSFFKPGLKRLLTAHFDSRKLLLQSHGNAGLAASFLMGITVEDAPPDLFSFDDPEYPIVLTARAVKPFSMPAELAWAPAVEHPEVSIIIPMFNVAGTIKETLFSVSRQSYGSFEILVVDDGSTDLSRNIVEDFARQSRGRITVLEHASNANCGLALSRNLAMEAARGEFLVFLDADDTIHPEKLAHDVHILRSRPEVAAVVGRALWWWDGAGEQDAYLDMTSRPCGPRHRSAGIFQCYLRDRGWRRGAVRSQLDGS